MTYQNDGVEAEYVVTDPAYVEPVVAPVERSWLSRNWWLPLLAALALATLLIWLANRNMTCATAQNLGNFTTEQENSVIAHLETVIPEIEEANRTQALTAARNVCIARLEGATGSELENRIGTEFNFITGGLGTGVANGEHLG